MEKLLPFRTREQFDAERVERVPDAKDVTADELYRELIMVSFAELNHLVGRLKQSGKWNQTANKLMYDVRDDIGKVCAAIAGVKGYGASQGQQKQAQANGRPPVIDGSIRRIPVFDFIGRRRQHPGNPGDDPRTHA